MAAVYFGKAIGNNPKSALYFARRAECHFKIDKPLCARRDADKAIKLNPDSAKAYKVRGMSFSKLEGGTGLESALKDLRIANQLDYDDAVNLEIKRIEKMLSERNPQPKASSSSSSSSPFSSAGLNQELLSKIMQDPGLLKAFQNPRLMAAVSEVAQDPQAIYKYKDDPQVMGAFLKFSKMSGMKF